VLLVITVGLAAAVHLVLVADVVRLFLRSEQSTLDSVRKLQSFALLPIAMLTVLARPWLYPLAVLLAAIVHVAWFRPEAVRQLELDQMPRQKKLRAFRASRARSAGYEPKLDEIDLSQWRPRR
jgi:chromate transport protein ChrA